MRRELDHYHRIRTLAQLRHARERVQWHLDVTEDNLRRDWGRIVDLWSVRNIARLATGHLEHLHEVIEMLKSGYSSVKEFIQSRKKEHRPTED